MKIPFRRKIRMFIQRLPIQDIQELSDLFDNSDFSYALEELECHALAGGDIKELSKCVEVLFKNKLNFKLWDLLICQLAGKNLDKICALYISNKNNPNFDIQEAVFK